MKPGSLRIHPGRSWRAIEEVPHPLYCIKVAMDHREVIFPIVIGCVFNVVLRAVLFFAFYFVFFVSFFVLRLPISAFPKFLPFGTILALLSLGTCKISA